MASIRDLYKARGRENGNRWEVRYKTPDNKGRSKTFAKKTEAEQFIISLEHSKLSGTYVDPRAGRVTFEEYSRKYFAERTDWAPTTRDRYNSTLKCHLVPRFGSMQLASITSSNVRAWHAELSARHPATAAKGYRLLRAMMNTAVTDGLIIRNPCRVNGGGEDRSPERPTATVPETAAVLEAIPERMRVAVLLAAWCHLRWSELSGLLRQNVDLLHGWVEIIKPAHQLSDGSRVVAEQTKSEAGRRRVAIPDHIIPVLEEHLARFVALEPDAVVFTGEKGGALRPHVLGAAWRKARASIGRPDLHFHDLRHSGNTWAAATGASTRELMARMGHSNPAAALRYQHATSDRDRVIADALADLAKSATITQLPQSQREAPEANVN